MTAPAQRRSAVPLIAGDAFVVPGQPSAGPRRGPRVTDDVWDLSMFYPRSTRLARLDFTTLPDETAARTVQEYLYSRLRHAIPCGRLSSGGTRPLKLTSAYSEFRRFKAILESLRGIRVDRLADVTQHHLDAVLADWKSAPCGVTARITLLRHVVAHQAFLSRDHLTVYPWPGRTAQAISGHRIPGENTTDRIPEPIMGPLLRAALFYVETASHDIQAARRELHTLEAARARQDRLAVGDAAPRVRRFLAHRRQEGRGLPALPGNVAKRAGDVPVLDGIAQAPNFSLIELLSGIGSNEPLRPAIIAAGRILGYEEGGLNTTPSPWPPSGLPWRPRLDPVNLIAEEQYLRTACWILIAYLSGMRDQEVRELRRDCARTETGEDGRIRYKIRGRVFKHRKLGGDEAEWVVLEVVHTAVGILLDLNDDPTHLFATSHGQGTYKMISKIPHRLNTFRDHVNDLFSTPEGPFIPNDVTTGTPDPGVDEQDCRADPDDAAATGLPWRFNTRQFRRTLAWYIAHQPFGVVAGARQYKHAEIVMFEGYAGTSASGFAAEVESEQAVARLDYLEELYRDWNDAGATSGGAAHRVDAEFARIRRELGDLPGVVCSPPRLRIMLKHLSKTLHPGILNDCFYQPATAVCRSRAKTLGRPLPLHNMCQSCSNARRSTVHLPRLTTARDQAQQVIDDATSGADEIPRLQQLALTNHLSDLNRIIAEIDSDGHDADTEGLSRR